MNKDAMRECARLVSSEPAKMVMQRVSLRYILDVLNRCCDEFGGCCDGCPDEKACTKGWDKVVSVNKYKPRSKRREGYKV